MGTTGLVHHSSLALPVRTYDLVFGVGPLGPGLGWKCGGLRRGPARARGAPALRVRAATARVSLRFWLAEGSQRLAHAGADAEPLARRMLSLSPAFARHSHAYQ